MNEYQLVGLAALIVLAVGGLLFWYHKRTQRLNKERHIKALQRSLGIKPGSAPAKKPGAEPQSRKPAGDSKDAGPKNPGTAIMRLPNPDGLLVNGSWLNQMRYTTDPDPILGTRASVRDSLARARSLCEKCNTARKQKNWAQAEEHIEAAFQELNKGLRRDHWYLADLLNQYGCLRFDQGFYVEAREIWEQSEMVCHEWPDACTRLLPTVESNLKMVKDMLGF